MFEQIIVYLFYTVLSLVLLGILSSVIFNKVKKYTIKVFNHKMKKIDTLMEILENITNMTLHKYNSNPELCTVFKDKQTIIEDLNSLTNNVFRLYNILSKDLKELEKVDNKVSLFRKQESLTNAFNSLSKEIFSSLNYVRTTFFKSPTSEDIEKFKNYFSLLNID